MAGNTVDDAGGVAETLETVGGVLLRDEGEMALLEGGAAPGDGTDCKQSELMLFWPVSVAENSKTLACKQETHQACALCEEESGPSGGDDIG